MAEQMDGGNATEQNSPSADQRIDAILGSGASSPEPGSAENPEGQPPAEPEKPWDSAGKGGDWDGVPKGARQRIQKLAAENRRQREEFAESNARTQQLLVALLELEHARQPEMKREEFASEGEYLAYHLARMREKEQLEQLKQTQKPAPPPDAEVDYARQAWMGKVETAKADLPDYEQVVYGARLNLPPAVLAALSRSDVGPHVLYTIARAGLSVELEDMDPAGQARFVAGLESRVHAWKAGMRAPQQQAPAQAPVQNAGNGKPAVPPPPPRMAASGPAAKTGTSPRDWINSRNENVGVR